MRKPLIRTMTSLGLVMVSLLGAGQVVSAQTKSSHQPSFIESVDSFVAGIALERFGVQDKQEVVYRLYRPKNQAYFYTSDLNERKLLKSRGWQDEGFAWKTAPLKGQPVYRFYHKDKGLYFYTRFLSEYGILKKQGWSKEGVAFYSSGDLPIYRLYNRKTKRYLYTKDTAQYEGLAKKGWTKEGIAFYGLVEKSTPTPSSTASSSSSSSSSTSSSTATPSSSSTSTRPSSSSSTSTSSSSSTTPSSSSTQPKSLEPQKRAAKADIDASVAAQKAVIQAQADATDEEKAAAITELEKVAQTSKDAIDKAITEEAIEDLKDKALEEIPTILADAKTKAAAKSAIDAAVAAQKAVIATQDKATDDEKAAAVVIVDDKAQEAKAAIDQARSKQDIEAIEATAIATIKEVVADAKIKDDAIQAIDAALSAQKAQVVAQTDATDEEKQVAYQQMDQLAQTAKDAINQATTNLEVETARDAGVEQIGLVVASSDSKVQAKAAIDQALVAQKAAIALQTEATDEEKTVALSQVEAAADQAKSAIDAATTDHQVATEKDAGLQTIAGITATATVKDQAKSAIDAALTEKKAAIASQASATDEEKAAAQAKAEATATAAKAAIDAATTNAQVAEEEAKGVAAVSAITVETAVKAAAKEAIAQAAQAKKAALNDRADLSEEDKAAALEQVDQEAQKALAAIDAATTNAKVEAAQTTGVEAIEAINPPPSILKQKTIAFNVTDRLTLVRYENGQFSPVTSLSQAPAAAADYFVLANNAHGKELLLPIEQFETKDGKVEARVTASQLHRYDTKTKKYESGLTLVFDNGQFKAGENSRIDVALSDVPSYDAQKAVAYANAQKLVPFYNNHVLVEQGNLLTGNLASKEIRSLTPLIDKNFVVAKAANVDAINGLLVYFADGSAEILPLTPVGRFESTGVYEYKLGGTEVLYTPEAFISDTSQITEAVANYWSAFDYYGSQMYAKYSVDTYQFNDWDNRRMEANFAQNADPATTLEQKRRYRMEALQLEESFNRIKNSQDEIANLLGSNLVADFSQPQVADYYTTHIKGKGLNALVGLSYLDRWYRVDFNGYNLAPLTKYQVGFFGKEIDTLDYLSGLGHSHYHELAERTDRFYANKVKNASTENSLIGYLDTFRRILTTDTANDWFKKSAKAYIVEVPSDVKPEVDVTIWTTLGKGNLPRMILPLLTQSREQVYLTTNMSTFMIGGYDAYINPDWATTNPALYQEKVTALKAQIAKYANLQGKYIDFWYRISLPTVRDRLYNYTEPPITWDNFKVTRFNDAGVRQSDYWAPAYGELATPTIKEFFTPIGKWIRNNGSGAFANGSETNFVGYNPLSDFGHSVYTHETVHNQDGRIYLGGYGRRDGMGAEAFATGMLQSLYGAGQDIFGINNSLDLTGTANLYMNADYKQFQTTKDTDDYFRHQMDLLYTLELAEADALIKLTDAQQRKLIGRTKLTGDNEHSGAFTDEEWAELRKGKADGEATFTSLDDLISHNTLVRSKKYFNGSNNNRNGYNEVPLFAASYGIDNYTGYTGGETFKRMSFHFWGEYGYENGFVGFTSNKHKAGAAAAGKAFNDSYIISQMSGGTYTTMNEFKKGMYERRLADASRLSPVRFGWTNGIVTLQNFDELKTMMAQAVQADANAAVAGRNPQSVVTLKQAIYKAYKGQTNDFRNSIYQD